MDDGDERLRGEPANSGNGAGASAIEPGGRSDRTLAVGLDLDARLGAREGCTNPLTMVGLP